MIIDAMDLLYTRRFEGFCLITSDSDFTGLAVRLREEGLAVYGFGEQKTPEAFRNACHKFIFTEVLRKQTQSEKLAEAGTSINATTATSTELQNQQTIPQIFTPSEVPKAFIVEALEKAVNDTGWAELGTFGNYLQKIQPSFDSRLYGFKKLSDLVKGKPDLFLVEERQIPGGTGKALYVKAK